MERMEQYEREVELIDYIEVVLKHKWLILLATLACMAGGALYTWTRSATLYEASALMFISSSAQTATKDTEVEVPSLSADFYRAVALSDDIRLTMDRYTAGLTDSLGVEPAGVSLEARLVERTGIELKVVSGNPALPVPVVHAWTDTFMARTQGLNYAESGQYYTFVLAQFDTAQRNMEAVEQSLEEFEQGQQISFLQTQKDTYEKELKDLQTELIRTRISLEAQQDSLQRARDLVEAMEVDGQPIYLHNGEGLQQLNGRPLPELARQTLDNILELKTVEEAGRRFEQDSSLAMVEFDAHKGFPQLQRETGELQKTVDMYRRTVLEAGRDSLMARQNLQGLEQEMKKHQPVLEVAKAIADEELWKQSGKSPLSEEQARKLDALKLYSEEPNPVYLALEEKRAQEGLTYETALVHAREGREELPTLEERLQERQRRLFELQKARQELEDRFARNRVALEEQRKMLEASCDYNRRNYLDGKQKLKELSTAVPLLRRQVQDLETQQQHLQEVTRTTTDELVHLLTLRERLTREKKIFEDTFGKFAKLVEEARIAREKAGSNLRIVTQAATVQARTEPRLKKVMVSGVVGLLASTFLAFFLEYIHKARALRLQNPRQDNERPDLPGR